MIKNKLGLLSLVTGLFLSVSAQAALVNLSFTGTTNSGASMDATFSVDSADITPAATSGDAVPTLTPIDVGFNFPLSGAQFSLNGGSATTFDSTTAYYGPDGNFETFGFFAGDYLSINSSSFIQLGFSFAASFLYDTNTNNVTLNMGVRDPVTGSYVDQIYTGSNFSVDLRSLNPNGVNGFDGFTNTESFTVDTLNISVSGVSAVPVPAAAWLFGSGLIGLFGFARKKSS